ncbi:hypothetical protein C8R44DRAFT_730144 [Mycena epipterygia]|nr:hypothetical protein C8R44DRAFT_730144 [Mycena epipterygia]
MTIRKNACGSQAEAAELVTCVKFTFGQIQVDAHGTHGNLKLTREIFPCFCDAAERRTASKAVELKVNRDHLAAVGHPIVAPELYKGPVFRVRDETHTKNEIHTHAGTHKRTRVVRLARRIWKLSLSHSPNAGKMGLNIGTHANCMPVGTNDDRRDVGQFWRTASASGAQVCAGGEATALQRVFGRQSTIGMDVGPG